MAGYVAVVPPEKKQAARVQQVAPQSAPVSVPEPGSAALFGLAVAVLGFCRGLRLLCKSDSNRLANGQ